MATLMQKSGQVKHYLLTFMYDFKIDFLVRISSRKIQLLVSLFYIQKPEQNYNEKVTYLLHTGMKRRSFMKMSTLLVKLQARACLSSALY